MSKTWLTSGTARCACGKTISGNKVACGACLNATADRHAKVSQQFTGVLEILNVGAGDVKINFDKDNPQETIRARRIVTDMLRRGYALVVEIERDGVRKYERIQSFDEKNGEYLIADFDPLEAHEADMEEAAARLRSQQESREQTAEARAAVHERLEGEAAAPEEAAPAATGGKRRGRPPIRVPMEGVKATAIARSSGG